MNLSPCTHMAHSKYALVPSILLALLLSHCSVSGFHPQSSVLPQNTHHRARSTFLSNNANNDNADHRHPSQNDRLDLPSWISNEQARNITASVEKKVRVAKAQAEIDRILSGPDAPFDLEAELQKVVSIAPPVTDESPVQQQLDADLSRLEQDLYQAVKQQDYQRAAHIKREISLQHIDDSGAVLQVNAAFYKAFSEKNYKNMESLWLQDGTSTCIHPSSKPLVGAKAVLKSWERMFSSVDKSFQRNWMEPADIRLSIKGASMAIVTCDEYVYGRRFVRGQKRHSELLNKLTATNIFRKVDGKWYLCHHHASWHADSEAAKQALKHGTALGDSNAGPARSPSSASSSSEEAEDLNMNGILGMSNFGPLLGSPSGDGNGGKPTKRIVIRGTSMSDLNDILSQDIESLLSDTDAQDESGAVIHFGSMKSISNNNSDEDNDDDDDDVIEDVVVEDLSSDGDGNDDAVPVAKEWQNANERTIQPVENTPKDALRQDCIAALRRLCDQGSISPKQKRVLLTDIISCSAKGEFSMVEVAYELLCGEGDDKDAAEEEFADQCRVFASSLSDTSSGTIA